MLLSTIGKHIVCHAVVCIWAVASEVSPNSFSPNVEYDLDEPSGVPAHKGVSRSLFVAAPVGVLTTTAFVASTTPFDPVQAAVGVERQIKKTADKVERGVAPFVKNVTRFVKKATHNVSRAVKRVAKNATKAAEAVYKNVSVQVAKQVQNASGAAEVVTESVVGTALQAASNAVDAVQKKAGAVVDKTQKQVNKKVDRVQSQATSFAGSVGFRAPPTVPSTTNLTRAHTAGETLLLVTDPSVYKAGDGLVVDPHTPNAEEVAVVSTSANGVAISPALKFNHIAGTITARKPPPTTTTTTVTSTTSTTTTTLPSSGYSILTVAAAVGATTVDISRSLGFVKGQVVIIGAGSYQAELNQVVATNAFKMTLQRALKFSHAAGEVFMSKTNVPLCTISPGETVSITRAQAGSSKIQVCSVAGFAVSDVLTVGVGQANVEAAVVKSIDRETIILTKPLLGTHLTGSMVHKRKYPIYDEVTFVVERCSGLSSPASYVWARYGLAGTPWLEMQKSSGRLSNKLKVASVNPTFSPAFAYRMMGTINSAVIVLVYNAGGGLLGSLTKTFDSSSLGTYSLVNFGEDVKLDTQGTCHLKFFKGNALKNMNVAESDNYEMKGSVAQQRAVNVNDITGIGPLFVGVSPLPANLQGLWWLTDHGKDTALMSFGGPNDDGGGMNTGFITGAKNVYKIRGQGERSMSMAQPTIGSRILRKLDPDQEFEFNSAVDPTFAKISVGSYTGFRQYTMEYQAAADPTYPNSKIWLRMPAHGTAGVVSKMVQVIDGNRKRVEPAFTKFATYMNSSSSGQFPGWVFYASRYASPSPGAKDIEAKASRNIGWMIVCMVIGALLLCCCCCCAFLLGCRASRSKSRTIEGYEYLDVDEDDGVCGGGFQSDEEDGFMYGGQMRGALKPCGWAQVRQIPMASMATASMATTMIPASRQALPPVVVNEYLPNSPQALPPLGVNEYLPNSSLVLPP